MLNALLYPGVPAAHWQMLESERIALLGLLLKFKPRNALEVGVFHGGSLTLIAQHTEHVWACDIDPEVPGRFPVPDNVDLRIGHPDNVLDDLLADLDDRQIHTDLVLIDADHSMEGVRRDIMRVLRRKVPPQGRQVILMHDSGNPACRAGILAADWDACPFVHMVEVDFVPGQMRGGEVWGGFALACLSPDKRVGKVDIRQGSYETLDVLHRNSA